MEDRVQRLEQDVETIKQRNLKVEADKAWETSVFRILSITLMTYIIAAVVMNLIGVNNFWLNALVPTLGFFLSVQSLPILKRWWLKKHLGGRKDR